MCLRPIPAERPEKHPNIYGMAAHRMTFPVLGYKHEELGTPS